MAHGDPRLWHQPAHPLRGLLDGAHAVVHVVDLAATPKLAADRLLDQLVVVGRHVRLDRLALLGRRLDDAHVADAADRHVQRARDRRRRQREHVELRAQLLQALLLHDSEAVLLVDDEEPEAFEAHVALEQAMRADDDVDLAALEPLHRARLRLVVDEPRQHLDHDRKVLEPLAEYVEVLLREHGGWRQQGDLLAAHRRFEGRAQRELGLAEADVAAEQAVHGTRSEHVAFDRSDR